MKKIILASTVALITTGCANNLEISDEVRTREITPPDRIKMMPKRGSTYVREISVEEQLASQKITRTAKNISLMDALSGAFPTHEFIPTSPDVDLSRNVDVRARSMKGNDFIQYLQSATGYEMKVNSNVIYISSYTRKEWNLSAFAVTRSIDNRSYTQQSGSADTSSSQNGDSSYSSVAASLTEDEWVMLIEGARDIVGVEDDDDDDDENTVIPNDVEGGLIADLPPEKKWERFEPYVHGIRTAGIITAAGPAYKMAALDTYINKSMDVAHSTFNIDIKSFDVIIDNSKQKTIDWDILRNGGINGNPFDLTIGNDSSFTPDAGVFSIGAGYQSGSTQVDMMIGFLETYGEVEVTDQPNLSVMHGVPAMVTAATEFSYVADFEQTQDDNGNTTVTPRFERLRVGVSLAVTARKLEDNHIMLDIWPVISDIVGEDKFVVNTTGADFNFSTPRTALREFSTRVVANSGESIHLGGLISEKVQKALTGLPIENDKLKGVLDVPFGDVNNEVSRRELVLLVTPTIIEGRR